MKAIKFLLLPALAFGLVLGWVQWLGSVQVRAPGGDQANDKGGVPLLTSEPSLITESSNVSPPKLDLPESIKPTVEPGEASPLANDDPQFRGITAPGAARLDVKQFEKPAGIKDSIEFRAPEPRKRSDWQTPPRLNLKPGGLSTPFSKPDWYDHPPLDRTLDGRPIPKPRGRP